MKIEIKRTKKGIQLGKEIKKYRVSGFMDEVGAVQEDVEATSKRQARSKSSLDEIINVTELL